MGCVNHDMDSDEARCVCGQLVARLRLNGVELKCKRCKRIVMVPYAVEKGSVGEFLRRGA